MNIITGSSAFLSLLEDEEITYLFGNPGTTELPIMAALSEHPSVQYIVGLNEAVVVAMADGYARASGRLSACNVHVAPGLGNAMGALYNAKWWGSPVLLSAGQQEQGHGLTEPMLYAPLVAMATPLVKWAIEVHRLQDLPRIVHRAAKIALTPPTGPVFISLPGDILNASEPLDLGTRTRVDTNVRPSKETLNRLALRLLKARRPVIIAGHEVAAHDAMEEASQLAEILGAPVYQQTVPHGAHFPSEHPAFMGALSRNQSEVRDILQDYDLLVCLGADLLCMSVWSPIDPLPEGLPIVHLGLHDWEIGKNYPTELAVHCHLKQSLPELLSIISKKRSPEHSRAARRKLEESATRNWLVRRDILRKQVMEFEHRKPITPDLLMERIVTSLPKDAVIVDEGIASTQNLLGFLPFRERNSYFGLASGGLGFALPGSIGIHLAHPQRPLIAIVGDGSAMFTIQALWTAAHLELPITYVIANNKSYRILKERLLAFHGTTNFFGMDLSQPEIDFVTLAQSLGVEAKRISDPSDIVPAIRQFMAKTRPTLLDVVIDDGF